MSFAICRMQKMKSHDLKGMQFHNQRERESRTNPDIDPERTKLNYDLVNAHHIDYNQQVKEIIESQKTGTRKTRKDAVLVNELVITSDRDFFDKLSPGEEKRFFEESFKLFSERYGEQNVAYAMIHVDEKTPHMHLGIVPMRDGKLQGKNVFNRQELQWIQEEFPKYMQGKGFDLQRGEKGSDREHLTTQDFKAKTLKEKVETLETTLEEKQAARQNLELSIKDIENRLSDLGKSLDHVQKIDDVEVKQEKKMGLFASERVILERKDFDGIKTLAKASESLKIENRMLKFDYEFLKRENKSLEIERETLQNENRNLRKQNRVLEKENKFLYRTIEKIKSYYNDRVQGFNQTVGTFKAIILDKMGEKLLQKHFTDDEERKGVQTFFALKEQEDHEKSKTQVKRERKDREEELGR